MTNDKQTEPNATTSCDHTGGAGTARRWSSGLRQDDPLRRCRQPVPAGCMDAPDIAGQGIANPSAQMLAAAMLLDHVGELDRGQRLRDAVTDTIVRDNVAPGTSAARPPPRSSGVRLPSGFP